MYAVKEYYRFKTNENEENEFIGASLTHEAIKAFELISNIIKRNENVFTRIFIIFFSENGLIQESEISLEELINHLQNDKVIVENAKRSSNGL